MGIMLHNGKILIDAGSGQIALDPACCCVMCALNPANNDIRIDVPGNWTNTGTCATVDCAGKFAGNTYYLDDSGAYTWTYSSQASPPAWVAGDYQLSVRCNVGGLDEIYIVLYDAVGPNLITCFWWWAATAANTKIPFTADDKLGAPCVDNGAGGAATVDASAV